jgi:DNA-directed RNA polymerase alpha subunit
MRLEELDLRPRSLNVLHRAGIVTLVDLVRRTDAEPGAMNNFGREDLRLVQEKLRALGLRLGMVRAGRRRLNRAMRRKRSS